MAHASPITSGDGLVFVLADDADLHTLVSRLLNPLGIDVQCFATTDAFFVTIEEVSPNGAIVDADISASSSPNVLSHLSTLPQPIPVIVVSRTAEIETAVSAIKAGARDYLLWSDLPLGLAPRVVRAFSGLGM